MAWLVIMLAENLGAVQLIYANKSKRVRKSFFLFTFSLSTELLEDKQRFKLGGVDTSPTYLLFLTLFLLFWTLILHYLNETNPGLTLFSAELPWCCFCAERKVLGMERNFARKFYTIKENFWSQDLPKRGT